MGMFEGVRVREGQREDSVSQSCSSSPPGPVPSADVGMLSESKWLVKHWLTSFRYKSKLEMMKDGRITRKEGRPAYTEGNVPNLLYFLTTSKRFMTETYP